MSALLIFAIDEFVSFILGLKVTIRFVDCLLDCLVRGDARLVNSMYAPNWYRNVI